MVAVPTLPSLPTSVDRRVLVGAAAAAAAAGGLLALRRLRRCCCAKRGPPDTPEKGDKDAEIVLVDGPVGEPSWTVISVTGTLSMDRLPTPVRTQLPGTATAKRSAPPTYSPLRPTARRPCCCRRSTGPGKQPHPLCGQGGDLPQDRGPALQEGARLAGGRAQGPGEAAGASSQACKGHTVCGISLSRAHVYVSMHGCACVGGSGPLPAPLL